MLQQQQQGAAFSGIEKTVDFGDMNKKRRGGEAEVAFAELAFGGIGTGHFLKKLSQLVEHAIHRILFRAILQPWALRLTIALTMPSLLTQPALLPALAGKNAKL